MEREQALEEVRFIKNLLEDTGREIGKSGWAFICLGLIVVGQSLMFIFIIRMIFNLKIFTQLPAVANWVLMYATCLMVPIIVLVLCFRIYRKQTRISVALEKQIWQVWWWMIVANFVILLGEWIIGIAAYFSQTGSGGNINYSLLATLPLIITGVLTKRKFFYGAAILSLILGLLPDLIFPRGTAQLSQLIYETFRQAFPYFVTGIYFLAQPTRHKAN